MPPCENFLYRFKAAPRGRSRRRHGRHSRAPADAPARLCLNAGRLARRLLSVGPRLEPPGGHRGRGGFDKGTLAAALIGHLRAGRSQPDPPTSVRAAAPCQIRHSVCGERGHFPAPATSHSVTLVTVGRVWLHECWLLGVVAVLAVALALIFYRTWLFSAVRILLWPISLASSCPSRRRRSGPVRNGGDVTMMLPWFL